MNTGSRKWTLDKYFIFCDKVTEGIHIAMNIIKHAT
jgi:hypothetical protein